MTLGERIYKFRTGKKLSQGDLADALDVSRQSISKWETDASVPELDKLVKLSEIFGVSLDELVRGKEQDKQEETIPTSPQAEPQIIYVEKPVNTSFTAAQILGVILLSCSLLCFVLFACFGKQSDLKGTFFLCLPVALWGILCLVTKHPLLWCCWCGSATWWIYVFILSAKWEKATLLLILGVVLVAISLWYTAMLQKKEQIHIPAWGWALMGIVLAAAALLLFINLIPLSTGSVIRPTEITAIPGASAVSGWPIKTLI